MKNLKIKLLTLIFCIIGSLNPAFAITLEQVDDQIQRDFTNYILRAFEISAETPDHYLIQVLKGHISESQNSIEQYFNENPYEESEASWQIRELKFLGEILTIASDSITSTENYYAKVDEDFSPLTARLWSYDLMIQSKKQMLDHLDAYLKWLHAPSRQALIRKDSDFAGRSLNLAFAMQSLMTQRFNMNYKEYDKYQAEVLEPLADLTIAHMKWLESIDVNELAYFNDLVFSSLGKDLSFFQPIVTRLIEPANFSLWKLNNAVTNPQWAYSGLRFVLREGSLIFASQNTSVTFEELVGAGLQTKEKDQFHLAWDSYFPENIVDYLLTEPGSLSHAEFLRYLLSIKEEWVDYSDVLKQVGISTPVKSHFESFIFNTFFNLDNWRGKGYFDLTNITHSFFAGYIPKNADDPGQAFNPNPASVFASFTNNKSIINSVTYTLTTAH